MSGTWLELRSCVTVIHIVSWTMKLPAVNYYFSSELFLKCVTSELQTTPIETIISMPYARAKINLILY